MRRFGDVAFDWMEHLARLYTVTIGAIGTTTRLRTENHGAHIWFFQTEGKRLFFLFPPQDAKNLYEETSGFVACAEGYAARTSPVDILYPNAKKHPLFAKANAQVAVLAPGEALVVPSGWWWYSV